MPNNTELRQLATALVCASQDADEFVGSTSVVRLHDVLSLLSTHSQQGTVVTADGMAVKLTHPDAQEKC